MMKHPAVMQTSFLLLTILISYCWLKNPILSEFNLQIFSVSIVLYFISKRLQKAKLWHLAPSQKSLEIIFASFAILMLIGSTGNTNSIFFPLSYLHLFFLVFSTTPITAFIITGAIIWFHYSLGISVDMKSVSDLLTLPIFLVFFLFAKQQYLEMIKTTFRLKMEQNKFLAENQEIANFIDTFLKPKLSLLRSTVNQSFDNQTNQELTQINQAVDAFEKHIDKYLQESQDNKNNEVSST